VDNAWVLHQKQDLVEHQELNHNSDHMEHGVLVLSNVDVEPRLDHEVVRVEDRVALDVLDRAQNQDRVEWQL